mmetsp:Transcript_20196/g.77333  ORF Transcript_20196/g.77333 Transcript_20196/m.77333 type:complete len:213 (+) Transcript_20196:349-987(+)
METFSRIISASTTPAGELMVPMPVKKIAYRSSRGKLVGARVEKFSPRMALTPSRKRMLRSSAMAGYWMYSARSYSSSNWGSELEKRFLSLRPTRSSLTRGLPRRDTCLPGTWSSPSWWSSRVADQAPRTSLLPLVRHSVGTSSTKEAQLLLARSSWSESSATRPLTGTMLTRSNTAPREMGNDSARWPTKARAWLAQLGRSTVWMYWLAYDS